MESIVGSSYYPALSAISHWNFITYMVDSGGARDITPNFGTVTLSCNGSSVEAELFSYPIVWAPYNNVYLMVYPYSSEVSVSDCSDAKRYVYAYLPDVTPQKLFDIPYGVDKSICSGLQEVGLF